MRTLLPLLLISTLLTPTSVGAQWAVGLLGGLGQDHGWQGRTSWMGALVERRLGDSSSFVVRLSGLAFTPMERLPTGWPRSWMPRWPMSTGRWPPQGWTART